MNVAVVEKIFLLLETLARAAGALSLKELAKATDLPKPTAHRLLQTLQTLGYVIRDGGTTNYLLGHRIQELARGPIHQRIKAAALPLMQRLHREVDETVNLGVREGLSIRYVDYLETTRSLRLITRPGQTDPIFSTALGRAILSAYPDAELNRIISSLNEAGTAAFDAAKLQSLIKTSRKRGWSEEQDETVEGISCLAVSLRRLGYPDAAVSLAVPTVRCNEACRRAIVTIFQEFNADT